MCRPTRLPYRGRLKWLGELSECYAPLLHRGIGGGMYTRKAHETREAPRREKHSAVDYNRALGQVARLNQGLRQIFVDYDVILTPATTGPAPPGLDATGDPSCCAL